MYYPTIYDDDKEYAVFIVESKSNEKVFGFSFSKLAMKRFLLCT